MGEGKIASRSRWNLPPTRSRFTVCLYLQSWLVLRALEDPDDANLVGLEARTLTFLIAMVQWGQRSLFHQGSALFYRCLYSAIDSSCMLSWAIYATTLRACSDSPSVMTLSCTSRFGNFGLNKIRACSVDAKCAPSALRWALQFLA